MHHFRWHSRSTLAHATPGVNHSVARLGHVGTINSKCAGKRGETIEDMFKQLPPHGKPDCATHLWKYETIDEAISRIATLEGLYKKYWMLSQKAQNANQGTYHKEMLTNKAQAAVNKAMHLLAIELNLERC